MRVKLVALLVVVVAAFAAIGVGSASADSCMGSGYYHNGVTCTTEYRIVQDFWANPAINWSSEVGFMTDGNDVECYLDPGYVLCDVFPGSGRYVYWFD